MLNSKWHTVHIMAYWHMETEKNVLIIYDDCIYRSLILESKNASQLVIV